MVGHSPSWFDSNKQPKKTKENALVMFPNAISAIIPNHIPLAFKSRPSKKSKKQKKKN